MVCNNNKINIRQTSLNCDLCGDKSRLYLVMENGEKAFYCYRCTLEWDVHHDKKGVAVLSPKIINREDAIEALTEMRDSTLDKIKFKSKIEAYDRYIELMSEL